MVPDWAKEFPFAVTICDRDAYIIYLNDQAAQTFGKYGGQELTGKSLFDCHSPHSNEIIRELLATGKNNIYTIEKNGTRKLICQSPWYQEGQLSGLVEISIILPDPMNHFIRQ